MCGETLRKRASLSGGLLLAPAGGKRASGAGISSRQHDAHALQEGGIFEWSEDSADGHSQAGQAGDAWCAHALGSGRLADWDVRQGLRRGLHAVGVRVRRCVHPVPLRVRAMHARHAGQGLQRQNQHEAPAGEATNCVSHRGAR